MSLEPLMSYIRGPQFKRDVREIEAFSLDLREEICQRAAQGEPQGEPMAKPKKSEEEERVEHLDDVIERAYNNPDLSPWHVREALRLLSAEIKELRKENRDGR